VECNQAEALSTKSYRLGFRIRQLRLGFLGAVSTHTKSNAPSYIGRLAIHARTSDASQATRRGPR
jgi:hypothetical protein